jgi:bisphosphoglycerate-independent phosphoglycerate mutase (AlkP superfamily)
MSVRGVADKVAEVLKEGDCDFVMCNFAPPDMVIRSFFDQEQAADDSAHRLATQATSTLPSAL